MTTCMHAKVHEDFFFFTLLAGAPSLGTFSYSINVLPTKKCWFSVTLVWSPYVYSPWPNYFHAVRATIFMEIELHHELKKKKQISTGMCPVHGCFVRRNAWAVSAHWHYGSNVIFNKEHGPRSLKPKGGSAGGVLVREREFFVLTGMPIPVLGESCTTSIKDFAIFPPHKKKIKKK